MTDPAPIDLSSYVDLTLFDRNPSELVERAVLDAVAKLPGWIPREGLTEMVLIEGHALQVAELIFAVNRVPGAVAEGILRLQGIERDMGLAATVPIEVTFVDDTGRTVLAGTRLRLTLGEAQVVATVDADIVAAPASFTAAGTATLDELTGAYNGLTPVIDLLDQNFYVESIAATGPVAGGRDVEDTPGWLSRASTRLARLVDTLLLPDHFVAAALEDPTVQRALAVDLYDPAGGPPGADPGHVTVAVRGAAGAALTAPQLTALFDAMRPLTADHLELHVENATVTAVDVDVTVERTLGAVHADVVVAVTEALEGYLSPDTWDWSASVYRNELISVIDQVVGVERVVTLDLPAADVPLAGVARLATAGVITVDTQ